MNTLLILDDDAETYRSLLEKRTMEDLFIYSATTLEEARRLVPRVEIILGRPDLVAQVLDISENLRWVQSTYAGVEPLCSSQLPCNYQLTGVKEIFGQLMSEYVFAYILAWERQLVSTYLNQQKRSWQPYPYRSLEGVTIGLVGLGSIGAHIAKTAAHFNMRVLGMKRTAGSVAHVNKVFLPTERSDFFSQLDYLVLTLPDTPETRPFLTQQDFALMRQETVLINVGRGANIQQESLTEALESKMIAGAVLDVFDHEPLPKDSPLWQLPNVLITPHCAADSFPEQICTIFSDNYNRYRQSKPLRYLVDFSKGY